MTLRNTALAPKYGIRATDLLDKNPEVTPQNLHTMPSGHPDVEEPEGSQILSGTTVPANRNRASS